jgi:hypothetical protein
LLAERITVWCFVLRVRRLSTVCRRSETKHTSHLVQTGFEKVAFGTQMGRSKGALACSCSECLITAAIVANGMQRVHEILKHHIEPSRALLEQ